VEGSYNIAVFFEVFCLALLRAFHRMKLRNRKPKPDANDSPPPDSHYGLFLPPDDDEELANDPTPQVQTINQHVENTTEKVVHLQKVPPSQKEDQSQPEPQPPIKSDVTIEPKKQQPLPSSPPSTSNASSPVQWLKDPPPSVPNPVPRSARRSVPKTAPPFAHDPLRGPTLQLPNRDDIEKLNGRHFLSTALLDYVLQKALPKNIPENIIIGSSNALSWFEGTNQKSEIGHFDYDPEGAKILRRKYQFYCHHGYQFFAANCGGGHFSVARVSFDVNQDDIFSDITIYDSNRRSNRKNTKPKPDEVVGKLLLELQKFLCNYCFFGTKGQEILTSRPHLALEKATFANCPQQQNGYDCGLFSLGALLHLVVGFVDLQDAFSAANVTSLRRRFGTVTKLR
jgi:hypothetical protein